MKGQVKTSLTVILFILIAAFVMIMGYRGIQGLLGQSCEAQRATFEKKIVGFFDEYDDFGSVHRENLNLPCDYRQICFIDSQADTISSGAESLSRDKQELLDSAVGDSNIILFGETSYPLAWSDKVQVKQEGSTQNVLCVEQQGTASIVFEGQGQRTLVRRG